MLNLEINGKVYDFRFGLGFLKTMNSTTTMPVDGMPGVKKDVGFRYTALRLIDGEVDVLVDVLMTANKTEPEKVNRADLEAYIEDENTDIDKLFEDVLDFLSQSNATKRTMKNIQEAIAKAEAEK